LLLNLDYHAVEYIDYFLTDPILDALLCKQSIEYSELLCMCEQVKAVYVKNLPKNVTQEQLKKLFERHGKITKVVLPPAKSGQEKNRIGFVHFAERSNAMKALKNTERYELEGNILSSLLWLFYVNVGQ